MSKHTPAPWFFMNGCHIFTGLGATNAEGERCEPNDGWLIADIGSRDLNMDEINANGRLISSAPDLLEALTYIEGVAMSDDFRDLPTIVATARAAIAKARGETK